MSICVGPAGPCVPWRPEPARQGVGVTFLNPPTTGQVLVDNKAHQVQGSVVYQDDEASAADYEGEKLCWVESYTR
jgi:hypothetical protein